ncbi:MAG: hypothetical protein H6907_02210 [Hyphomicrobiales bacterium]|nr:hypothetical protein [Hyphomicrobiales bacterium]
MTPPAEPGAGRLLRVVLWLWVAGATAAYLAQFRHLLRPILDLAGLS